MKKIITVFAILAISIIFIQGSYAGMEDKSDKLSQNQSNVFSPGYINASKQKTDAIIYQQNKPKTLMENVTEYVREKLGRKIEEGALDKPVPQLKKKTSQGEKGESIQTIKVVPSVETSLVDSIDYNVNIGSGTDKTYDEERLISEFINGERHIYVGFDNVGKSGIQEGIDYAASRGGGIVLVKGGTYVNQKYGIGCGIEVKDGVRLYGGYNESGERDLKNTPTIVIVSRTFAQWTGTMGTGFSVTGTIDKLTEINGFTIKTDSIMASSNPLSGTGISIIASVSNINNLRVSNNIIRGFDNTQGGQMGMAISVNDYGGATSKATISNNDIYYAWVGLWGQGSSVYATGNNIHNMSQYAIYDFNSTSSYENNVIWDAKGNIGFHYGNVTYKNNTIYGGTMTMWATRATGVFQDNIFIGLPNSLPNYQSQITNIGNIFDTGGLLGIDPSISKFGSVAGKGYSPENLPHFYNTIINSISPGGDKQASTLMNKYPFLFAGKSLLGGNGLVPEIKAERISSILKGLLVERGEISGLESGQFGKGDEAMMAIVRGVLEQNALAIPLGGLEGAQAAELDLAMRLANIMKNPTADQKLILDTLQALLQDTEKAINESGTPELMKASDDLLQMVAAILIAQAIPDLLKEGDISGIKGIFTELNTEKSRILLQYQDSTKPYYNEMVKELSKNMNILQLQDIISGKLSRDDLERIPRNELDKIVEKLRQAKDKSFETEYLLQEEAKLRKAYIDPNKRVMEDKMKDMMNGFTKRLSKVLEGVKK